MRSCTSALIVESGLLSSSLFRAPDISSMAVRAWHSSLDCNCRAMTTARAARWVLGDDWLTRMDEGSRRVQWPAGPVSTRYHAVDIGQLFRRFHRSAHEGGGI